MSSGPRLKKAAKISYKEECNNIIASVGSPGIDQEEVEALKGINYYLRSCF